MNAAQKLKGQCGNLMSPIPSTVLKLPIIVHVLSPSCVHFDPMRAGVTAQVAAPHRPAAAAYATAASPRPAVPPSSPPRPFRRPGALTVPDFLHVGQTGSRFFSPLPSSPSSSPPSNDPSFRDALPLLLYLPGIDGTGLIASCQFDDLRPLCALECLAIPVDDRASFRELVAFVVAYVRRRRARSDGGGDGDGSGSDGSGTGRAPGFRPVYLLGESFGGLLACAVALELQASGSPVSGLALVNPATSFPSSAWRGIAPALASLPEAAWRLLPFALTPVLADPPRILAAALAAASEGGPGGSGQDRGPAQRALAAASKAADILLGVGKLTEILPRATLAHKVALLEAGAAWVNPRLVGLAAPVLVVVGEQDLLLPSSEEATRLGGLLADCQVVRVPGGHSTLQGNDFGIMFDGLYLPPPVSLAELLAERHFFGDAGVAAVPLAEAEASTSPARRRRLTTGYRKGRWQMEVPDAAAIEPRLLAPIRLTRQLCSPVFLSTGDDGHVEQGLGAVPWADLEAGTPLLIVADMREALDDVAKARATLPGTRSSATTITRAGRNSPIGDWPRTSPPTRGYGRCRPKRL